MLSVFEDDRGILSLVDLPFDPKRIFFVSNVPKGCVRGKHAHKQCRQLLVCLQGEIELIFQDKLSIILKANESYLLENKVWCEQKYLTGNDILLSICSVPYDPDDYLYDSSEVA